MDNYNEFEMIDVPSGDSFDRMSRADALAELELNRELLKQKRKSLEGKDGAEDIHAMQSILALEEAIADLEKALGIAEFGEDKKGFFIDEDEPDDPNEPIPAKRVALKPNSPDAKPYQFDEDSSLTSEFLTEVSDNIEKLKDKPELRYKAENLALLAKEYIINENLDFSALHKYPLIKDVLKNIMDERNFDGEFAEIEYVEPGLPDVEEERKRTKDHEMLLENLKKKHQVESILKRIDVALKDKKLKPEDKSKLQEKKDQLEGMMGKLVKFAEEFAEISPETKRMMND